MRFWNSWKFYVAMIVIGLAAWVFASLMVTTRPLDVIKSLPLGTPGMKSAAPIHIRDIYREIFEWAKIIGQILSGGGAVFGAIRALIKLIWRK